jgi:Putative auto-transporter adhesin, head GIN domain
MRALTGGGLALATLLAASGASAASVNIKNAVARVTIIPEARSDVSVTIVRDDPHHPLKVSVWPDGNTDVDGGYFGGLFGGMTACNSHGGRPSVRVFGANISYGDMAQVVVRTPLDARVSASGAVFGEVGRSENLDLHLDGCGDWVVANVHGHLNLADAGSGDVRTGSAGSMRVSAAGSGDVYSHGVSNGLDATIAGSSDIHLVEASGPLKVRISGSGDLGIGGGHASDMDVFIAGSGDVNFKGVADSITAFVAGSGDINVARVTGAVKKSVAGSGDVNIGR